MSSARRPAAALAALAVGLALASAGAARRSAVPIGACSRPPAPPVGRLGAVAYMRARGVHVVDLASGRDRVLGPALPDSRLAFSGDGRWLSTGRILFTLAGGHACQPFPGTGQVVWAPVGELLAATTAQGVELWQPGGRPRLVAPAGWGAAGFDPSGTRLALTGPRFQLAVLDFKTGRRRVMYRSANVHVGPPELARWTLDGRWILLWTDSEGSASIAADGLPLFAVPAAGGRPVRIAPKVLATPRFVIPCGTRRLLITIGLDRYVSADKSLSLTSPPAWRIRNIFRDPLRSWYDPSCSADGGRIVATATPNRDEGRIDSATRTIWQLAPTRKLLLGDPASHTSIEGGRLSRDGRYLLYAQHPARYGAASRLYLRDLETGRTRGPLATITTPDDYYGLRDWDTDAAWYQPGS